jgi:uncharacterized protein YqiB (DUF1249 family)
MMRNKKRYIVNFPGHMAECEFNYHRLIRLMPELDDKHMRWHYIVGSQSLNEIGVMIEVIDEAKYTTTIRLSVFSKLPQQINWLKPSQNNTRAQKPISLQAKPFSKIASSYSLDVRLYNDASVAEVIAWDGHRRFQARHQYPNTRMYHEDEKAQLNQFLGELLEYCLAQGRVMMDVVTVM